jgi:hypothetical protein
MNESGLTDLALQANAGGGRSPVNIEHATFQNATDADLVAQRTVIAMQSMLLAG